MQWIDRRPDEDYATLREQMVVAQLQARGIREPRVLDALLKVPRHEFLPPEQQRFAYDDRPLPIGCGQTISQPYMVAVMTEALKLRPPARVLEIGTGSGYQAAVLATLAREVISIERIAELAAHARETLARLGHTNVTVLVGDGSEGCPERQPYDGIIVTAGAPYVPETLRAQLADGGRLAIPVGSRDFQELLVVERRGERFCEERREGCVFVPLVGKHGWKEE